MQDHNDIYGIATEAIRKEMKVRLLVSPDELDSASADSIVALGIVPFKKWRVIGLGALCVGASTNTHDPVLHFGTRADVDKYGILTITTTGDTNVHVDDYVSRDFRDVLPVDVVQSGVAYVWSDPDPAYWAVWQTTIQELQVKAIGAALSGKWQAYALIEVDAERKW